MYIFLAKISSAVLRTLFTPITVFVAHTHTEIVFCKKPFFVLLNIVVFCLLVAVSLLLFFLYLAHLLFLHFSFPSDLFFFFLFHMSLDGFLSFSVR